MSRFFPHTEMAEDQPLAHTILTTHVLTRGATMGAMIGAGIFGLREASRALWVSSPAPTPLPTSSPPSTAPAMRKAAASAAAATASSTSTSGTPLPATWVRLMRTTGTGTAWAVAGMAVGLTARAKGWELIEWQDRSWRLLENRGQLEVDDWTVAGTVAGLVAATAAAASSPSAAGRGVGTGLRLLGWRGLLGAAGSGSVAGMLGYLGWRYGVHRGKGVTVV